MKGVSIEIKVTNVFLSCAGSVHFECDPFPHCKIDNFLQNEQFAKSLRDELLQLNFHRKSNDLYKFQQVSMYFSLFTLVGFFISFLKCIWFLQSDDLKENNDQHTTEIRYHATQCTTFVLSGLCMF